MGRKVVKMSDSESRAMPPSSRTCWTRALVRGWDAVLRVSLVATIGWTLGTGYVRAQLPGPSEDRAAVPSDEGSAGASDPRAVREATEATDAPAEAKPRATESEDRFEPSEEVAPQNDIPFPVDI